MGHQGVGESVRRPKESAPGTVDLADYLYEPGRGCDARDRVLLPLGLGLSAQTLFNCLVFQCLLYGFHSRGLCYNHSEDPNASYKAPADRFLTRDTAVCHRLEVHRLRKVGPKSFEALESRCFLTSSPRCSSALCGTSMPATRSLWTMAPTGGRTADGGPCLPVPCGGGKDAKSIREATPWEAPKAAPAVEMLKAMGFEQAACLKALEAGPKRKLEGAPRRLRAMPTWRPISSWLIA